MGSVELACPNLVTHAVYFLFFNICDYTTLNSKITNINWEEISIFTFNSLLFSTFF